MESIRRPSTQGDPVEHYCEDEEAWVEGSNTTCVTCKARVERLRAEKRQGEPMFNLHWLIMSNRDGYTATEIQGEIYEGARETGRDIQRAR